MTAILLLVAAAFAVLAAVLGIVVNPFWWVIMVIPAGIVLAVIGMRMK